MNESNIEELLKALVKLTAAPLLMKELSDEKSKQIFNLTGKISIKEIAKKVKVSDNTVTKLWTKWELMGIVKKDGKNYKRIF